MGQPSDTAEFFPEKEEAHLRDYWKVVVKYRRLIIIVFMVVFGFGAYIISGATRMYKAAATIQIDPQNPQFIRIEEVLNLEVQSGDYFGTQHELMKSRALAAKVITELRLESNRAFTSIPIISPDPIKWLNSKFFGNLQSFFNYISAPAKSSAPKSAQIVAKNEPSPPIRIEESSSTKQNAISNVNPGLIGRYLSFLRVEPMRGTRLVRIVFITPDPYLSQQLANAHADSFVRMNLETRFELTKGARVFLDKKLAELRSKVGESEAELGAFRKAHGVVSMDRGENLIVERMIALNGSLTTARIKRIELESLRQIIQNKNVNEISEVMTNATIQQFRAAIELLTAEQVKLSTVFKPDHPRMVELSTRLTETRQRMKLAIDEVVRRIETDYASARNKEASLDAEAQRQKDAAIDLQGLGVKYSVLQGEVTANQKLYGSVQARLNETTISNDLPVSNMQVTELADSPGDLSSGGQQLTFLTGTASAALFLGVALAFCLAYFDSTFSSPDDVWRFLYVPTLGVVPELISLRNGPHPSLQLPKEPFRRLLTYVRARRADSLSKDLIVSPEPRSILSESYRSIRTALLFSQPETPPQTVLFTSPGPAEGKTVTTLNLAIALAQSGKSVLVIDADMRKGRCHKLLRLPNDRGLSNVLSGNLTLEESLQETEVPGLSLISRGVVPPNPADLLGSRKMSEVLEILRSRFEFILLDAPPVIGVTDASVLSAFCDGVVLVVHKKKTNRFSAREAVQTLESVRGHMLGVVLNGIDIRDPNYASYRYYYSSYYASVNAETENQSASTEQSIENPPESTGEDEPVSPTEKLASSTEELIGNAPKQLFDQLISKFSEAVGPMAPLIVRDHVELMRESMDAFPKSRLNELLDRVGEEVLNETLRNRFQRSMLQEIQLGRSSEGELV